MRPISNHVKTIVLLGGLSVLLIGAGGGLAGLFSTHPRTEERVRRLRAMAGDWTAIAA